MKTPEYLQNMQSKQENSSIEKHLYEYAVIRYIPRIEREEFINIGVVMMCKRKRWIKVSINVDESKIRALFPNADFELLRQQLESFDSIAAGRKSPIGLLEVHERFRWLTAVRSACISTSRPHAGLTENLDLTFDRIFKEQVAVNQ